MAELNFNALARPGPRGFLQGFQQGQEQRMTEDINRTNLETGRFKLDELKRDRAEMMQLQDKLKGMGQDPDLDKFMDVYISSGRPDYVKLGLEGKQKLKEQREFARLVGGDMAAPAAEPAPAPAFGMPAGAQPSGDYTSTQTMGRVPGVVTTPIPDAAPMNALAFTAPTPAAAPANALANPNAGQVQQTQKRINDLMQFAAANPGMANQAMSQAKLLQDQLELYSRRGQNEPADAVMMQKLGYPLTQAGYQAYRDAQRQERMLSPAEEAQRVRIATASRAPAQPRAEQPLEKVVDPATGKIVFASREEALRGRMTPAAAMESLPPKEIQKREAAYPQATSSVKGFETKSTAFIKDLEALRNHPGLSSITGIAAGRLPGLTADGRAAQAIYDKVVAKGGFQALQDMRDASKTGGALGNVSNQEGKQLTASFAAIDRRQEAKDVQAAIDQAIADIQGSQTRMREAYESTYSYKSGGGAAAPIQDVRSQADAILKGGN
jgi:hypothetical protein